MDETERKLDEIDFSKGQGYLNSAGVLVDAEGRPVKAAPEPEPEREPEPVVEPVVEPEPVIAKPLPANRAR